MKRTLFIITLFIFCIGLCSINNYPDNDLWARLIVGKYVVETLSILKYDFLSYTQTHAWYDHEWGASVFFYIALKYFGDSGLIFLKGILTALTLFFCYKTVDLRKPDSTISYNILYYSFMFLAAYKLLGATTRCLLFTCLFFSIFVYILELSRTGKKKVLILLPFIMVLWSNIHGGCLSGLGIICIYIAGEFLNKKPYKEYIYTLLGCLAALFINPYGIEYIKFLFMAATMKREYITEWQSPFYNKYQFSYFRYKLYLIIMLLTQFIYIIKNKVSYNKLDKTKFLIIISMAYLSITHIRHINFFIFTAGTLLYDEFYYLYNKGTNFIKGILRIRNERMLSKIRLFKEICIYFFLLIISLPPLLDRNKQINITTTEYPRYAVEFIKINNLTGNLFINFDWGSYAAYKLYPNNLIVMDGRYEEVYDNDLFLQLKDFHLVKNDWYKVIRENKTDVMIIEKKYPVYKEIEKHPDWKLVFENNLSGVFVPVTFNKKSYIMPKIDDKYYNDTKFITQIDLKKGDI